MGGEWNLKITSVYVTDNADNRLELNNKELSSYGELADLSSGDFNVTGTTEADTIKPIFNSVEVEPREVAVGDTVKVSILAEDAETGINSVSIFYRTPITEKQEHFILKYNHDNGKYETTIDIKDQMENGTWKITTVYITDNADNRLELNNKELSSYGELADLSSGDFNVTGTTEADTIKPIFNSVEVEPREVAVGDTVKVSILAEDAETGINSVSIFYQTPITEKQQHFILKYNHDNGKYETTIDITDQMENGTWKITTVYVTDNADNRLELNNKELSNYGELADLSSGNFNVTGTTEADTIKPIFNSVEVEPREVAVGDTVKVSILAEDAETGINSVSIFYQTPITEKQQHFILKYNHDNGKYETTIDITDRVENGTWKITSVYVTDNADNRLELNNKELSSYGELADLSSGDFTVLGDIGIKPLEQRVVTKNETWVSETIDGDVYIGPEAVLTINGNVTVDGHIYVLGALVSYGTFNVSGRISAKAFYYGRSTTLYHGTVNIRSGTNNIRSSLATNRPLEDIPIEVYTSPIIAENGIIKYIEGATLPITDMYIEEKKVDLRWNGTFHLSNLNIGSKDQLTLNFLDVFGNTINKQLPVEVKDTIAPTAEVIIPGGYYGGSKLVELNLSEAGTIYYTLNGEKPSVTSNIYGEPIEIKEDTTLKFIAVDHYGNQSEVYMEEYKFFHVDEVTDQTTSIKGSAQPNSTIMIKTETSEWTGTANESGEFNIQIPTLLAGTVIKVQAIYENKMESESIERAVLDVTGPVSPIVDEVTDQTTQVTGKAETETTVEVKVAGLAIGTGTVGGDGTFIIKIPLQKAGTTIVLTATDKAGNKSEETTVKVKDITAPTKPEVDEVTDQSTQITGKAEIGTMVDVKVGGSAIVTGTVGADGTFTIKMPLQSAGTTIKLTVTDKAGNRSEETAVKVKDITPPTKPQVDEVTNQSTQVTGNAEKGTTIEVKVDGTVMGSGTVKQDGTFTIEIPLQTEGRALSLIVIDEAGNKSEETTVKVKDAIAPIKPEINLITDQDRQVTGKAEIGTTITVKTNKTIIGTGVVEKDGTFSVVIPLQQRGMTLIVNSTDKAGNRSDDTIINVQNYPSIQYATHVQDYGWQELVYDGSLSGTAGKSKRLEAIKVFLDKNKLPYQGGITYRTHVQDYGWQELVYDGALSGTAGEAKRLEGIEIKLTGKMADYYDIYYRVHAQDYGWLDWAKNGKSAGTEGLTKRLEAIEIVLVQKGGKAPGPTDKPFVKKIKNPSVIYSTHVQDYGWMNFVKDGELSGTQGKAKRLEAIKINLQNAPYSGDIIYTTHVQDYGWLPKVINGKISGTSKEGKRLEALTIELIGELGKHYNIYYRVHIQDIGWLGWAKNGMKARSEGGAKRLEGIEIKLLPKSQGGTGKDDNAFIRL